MVNPLTRKDMMLEIWTLNRIAAIRQTSTLVSVSTCPHISKENAHAEKMHAMKVRIPSTALPPRHLLMPQPHSP